MTDTIDDRHAAETSLGILTDAVTRFRTAPTTDTWEQLVAAHTNAHGYCRPTCGFLHTGGCHTGNGCDCPCNHPGQTCEQTT